MERPKRKRVITSKAQEYSREMLHMERTEQEQNTSSLETIKYPLCVQGLDLNPHVKIEPLDYNIGASTSVNLRNKDQTQPHNDVTIKNEPIFASYNETYQGGQSLFTQSMDAISPLEDITNCYNQQSPIEILNPRLVDERAPKSGVPDFLLNPNKVFKVHTELDFKVTITVCITCNGGFLSSIDLRLHKEQGCTLTSPMDYFQQTIPEPSVLTSKSNIDTLPSTTQIKANPKGKTPIISVKKKLNKTKQIPLEAKKCFKPNILSRAKHMIPRKIPSANNLVTLVPVGTKGKSTLFKVATKGNSMILPKEKAKGNAIDTLIPVRSKITPILQNVNTIKTSTAHIEMKEDSQKKADKTQMEKSEDNDILKSGMKSLNLNVLNNNVDHRYNKQLEESEINRAIDNIPLFGDDNDNEDEIDNVETNSPVLNYHDDDFKAKPFSEKKDKEIQKLEHVNEELKIKPFREMVKTEMDKNGQERYICGFCGQVLKQDSQCRTKSSLEAKLRGHLLRHANKTYKCELCDFDKADKAKLKYHMEKMHTVGKQYICEICAMTFQCERNLGNHMSRHRRSPCCKLCGKKFLTNFKLKAHLVYEHNGATLLSCDLCGAKFTSFQNLKSHESRSHYHQWEICPYCGISFYNVKIHMAIKHGVGAEKRTFSCTICSYKTLHRHVYENHMLNHEGKKRFECDQCGWGTMKKHKWNEHMLKEHGFAERYHCKKCHFSAPTNREIYIHRKTHELDENGEKTANVTGVGSNQINTSWNDQLDSGGNHGSFKEYESNKTVPNLSENMVGGNVNPSLETYYSCAECNTLYGTEEDLSAHFVDAHSAVLGEGMFDENHIQTVTEEVVVDSMDQVIPELT